MAQNWRVKGEEGGWRLLDFVEARLGGTHSKRHLKKAIDGGLLRLNGRAERFSSKTLSVGDQITFYEEDLGNLPTKATTADPARILFEDEALLVYDKPAGVPSDEKGVISWFDPTYILANRLDRDTSGVLLIAKTPEAAEALKKQFKERTVGKEYLTLVDGIPPAPTGMIENTLGKCGFYDGQTIWGEVKKGGRHARTDWRLERKGKRASLLRCFPKTGRTHQIRVHLASIGHAVLGDLQYCKDYHCSYRPLKHLLHAHILTCQHPTTGEPLRFESPIPEDFATAMEEVLGS